MNQVINIPEGFELKKISETEYQIVPKERKFPKTWEEFCKMKYVTNEEYFINSFALPESAGVGERSYDLDRHLCPSKEVAEGILALIQLIQLRNYYNNGWKRDNNEFKECYAITYSHSLKKWIIGAKTNDIEYIFSFRTFLLTETFFNNFENLFDKLKYLF